MRCIERRLVRREPVSHEPELIHARFPRGDRRAPVARRAGRGGRPPLRRRGLVRRERIPEPRDFGPEPLRLGLLPARFANERLEGSRRGSLRLLGEAPLAGRPRFLGAGPIERGPGLRGAQRRGRGRLGGGGGFRLEMFDLDREALGLCSSLERGVAAAEPDGQLPDHRGAVADHRHPAAGKKRLERERRVEVRRDDHAREQARHGARGIAPHGVDEGRPADVGDPIEQPALRDAAGRGPRRSRPRGGGPGRPLCDHEHPSLRGELADRTALDDVGASRLVEGGLDRRPQCGVHDQVLVEPAAAAAPRGAGDPARLVVGQPGGDRLEPASLRGDRGPERPRPLLRGLPRRLCRVRSGSRGLAQLPGATLRFRR